MVDRRYNDATMTTFADRPVASCAPRRCNIASHLPRMAATVPDQCAIAVPWRRDPSGRFPCVQRTFAQMEHDSNRLANGLESIGITRGMRTIVMLRPGVEFTTTTFALFKIGAVPVLIDPGMGVSRMVECLSEIEPEAFIGIPPAQVLRVLHRRRFPKLRATVTLGWRLGWGGADWHELIARSSPAYQSADTASDETAAILFTTGSTGPPKGVVYEHGMFEAQIHIIREQYDIHPGEVELPAFPLFALFSTALGQTCVIPQMDPTRPASVNPANIVRDIQAYRVTSAFGSPAIWRRVAAYCVERGIRLPTMRRILTAGAPIPWRVIDMLHRILPPDGDVHTPYGATEALPVATIAGRELFGTGLVQRARRGEGTCVGRVVRGMDVRIIRISDEPIPIWSDDLTLPAGQRGEIAVAGPVVTKVYDHKPAATALHKIADGPRLWHRMGDIGYFDDDGLLWFCGRKAHRVVTSAGTRFTIECEAIFNEHPAVARSALVGVPPRAGTGGPETPQRPVIVIEPAAENGRIGGRVPRGAQRHVLINELLALAAADERTRDIRDVLFHPAFPVDIRHNAKIFRENLAVWATRELGVAVHQQRSRSEPG